MKKSSTVKTVIRNKRQGRHVQSVLAKRLGGKNVGTLGTEDISHEIFSIETKSKTKFVGQTFMNQAVRNSPKDKIPMVIVHILNQKHDTDLVMLRMKDWFDLYGPLFKKEKENGE